MLYTGVLQGRTQPYDDDDGDDDWVFPLHNLCSNTGLHEQHGHTDCSEQCSVLQASEANDKNITGKMLRRPGGDF